jgi:hypothetical protein
MFNQLLLLLLSRCTSHHNGNLSRPPPHKRLLSLHLHNLRNHRLPTLHHRPLPLRQLSKSMRFLVHDEFILPKIRTPPLSLALALSLSPTPHRISTLISTQQISILSGSSSIKKYEDAAQDHGSALTRSFCSNCGSPLYTTNSFWKMLLSS